MIKPFWVLVGLDPTEAGDTITKWRNLPAVVHLELADPPAKGGTPKGNGAARTPRLAHEPKNSDFIVQLLLKHGGIASSVIKQHFVDVHRNPSSVPSTLSDLQSEHLIKKDQRRDVWVLTKKTRDRLRTAK